jgi:hypothetical protein
MRTKIFRWNSPNKLPTYSIFANFIILNWLLFKPSVWQRYIKSIDPNLSPDFALADLKKKHWQIPRLWKLLLLGHGLAAIWVSVTITLCLSLFNIPSDVLVLIASYALLFSLIGGILGSLIISVAFGIFVGIVGGLLLTLPIAFANGYPLDDLIVFNMAENIVITVLLSVPDLPIIILQDSDPRALLIVLLGIFTASCGASIMSATTKTAYSQPQYRQMGSIMIAVLISGIAVVLIAGVMSVLATSAAWLQSGTLYVLAYDGLIVCVFGLSLALIWGLLTWRWGQGLLLGIFASSILALFTFLTNNVNTYGILKPILIGIHGGIENGMLYMLLLGLPYVLAKRIANPWAGILAGIFGSACTYIIFVLMVGRYSISFLLPFTIAILLCGLGFIYWRPLLFYPFQAGWNLLVFRKDEKQTNHQESLLHQHSAFWDEHQYMPLFGLETYLVMVAERYPAEGKAAIEYLSSTSQSWAAKEAQIELDARQLEKYTDVHTISLAHTHLAVGELSSSVAALLRSLSRISRDVKAALSQESMYNQRLALNSVEERLDGLLRELTRSDETYAQRFRPIPAKWRHTIADYVSTLTEAVETRQEICNPYIIGIPLTEHQEIFVGRSDISERIERLLLDSRRPPLLLYGQRRTGKTSLLNNLGKLLPSTITPLFIDLQGPTSLAKDYVGFLYNMSRAMITSAKRHRHQQLPALTREKLTDDPFTSFDEWLDEIEQQLKPNQTLLLILDEFSALEHVFNKGRLDEVSVLGMFRHIIQHRPRMKMLLSGSHTINEFERWASYLINVQTVQISYLQDNEALQLIEQPVKEFALRYEKSACERVMAITNSHPALVQLLCSEIVTLKNKQPINKRRLAQVSDVNAAIEGALEHGRFFFADIANNQVTEKGATILRFLAIRNASEETLRTHYPEEFETTMNHLLLRELIELTSDGYQFQVELIRRWFVSDNNKIR